MVAYKKDEMVGITKLSKSLGKYLDKVISNPFNKIAIIRRNEPEAVIVPIKEYEYLRAVADYVEDMEIAKTIKERIIDKGDAVKYLSEEDMEEYLKKRGID
jgi:PHD/YefM family antitoxin component YafN of YafNO toxin-antitoxin module